MREQGRKGSGGVGMRGIAEEGGTGVMWKGGWISRWVRKGMSAAAASFDHPRDYKRPNRSPKSSH